MTSVVVVVDATLARTAIWNSQVLYRVHAQACKRLNVCNE